jgi:hypothetical protein
MLVTFDDTSRREDLLDIIGDVTPDDTPLATMLATSTAKDTVHQWLEDYITPQTALPTFSGEGAAATYTALTQPVRRLNLTAILTQTFRVSGTERATNPGGGQDPLDYQAGKALRTWKQKQEYTLINGALTSGVSGTGAKMAGLINVITTLYTARNSGTSLSETEFQDMHQHSWEVGGTDNAFDLVLVPFGLKRKIDGFTAGATKYVDQSDKKLTQPVAIYETSAGVARIMQHRYVPGTAASVDTAASSAVRFLGIKEDLFRVAYLRKPFKEMLAKDGDRENGQIVGEFTLEYLGERTSVNRTGYATTG